MVLLGHVPIGAEIAKLIVRAGGEGEAQAIDLLSRRWCRSRAADGALLTLRRKAIPVGAIGFETTNFDVDRMGPSAVGLYRSALDDVAHRLVSCNLPKYGHRSGHAA
jgi:hypothetical protein